MKEQELIEVTRAFAAKGLSLLEKRACELERFKFRLEVFNHIIRVLVQARREDVAVEALRNLASWQLSDGSWREHRNALIPSVRATAFSVQMLYRGAKVFRYDSRAAVQRGIEYLLSLQKADGTWCDTHWGRMDATSMTIGTLIMLSRDPIYAWMVELPLRAACNTVRSLKTHRGTWQKRGGVDCVETTSHYLQKFIAFGENDSSVLVTVEWLLSAQGADGAWQSGDVDATCDAARALLLATTDVQSFYSHVAAHAVDNAVSWLLSNFTNEGIGSTKMAHPNLLHTADAVDTFLKYVHRREEPQLLLSAY
jgi:prenyltransferase beta subunit